MVKPSRQGYPLSGSICLVHRTWPLMKALLCPPSFDRFMFAHPHPPNCLHLSTGPAFLPPLNVPLPPYFSLFPPISPFPPTICQSFSSTPPPPPLPLLLLLFSLYPLIPLIFHPILPSSFSLGLSHSCICVWSVNVQDSCWNYDINGVVSLTPLALVLWLAKWRSTTWRL